MKSEILALETLVNQPQLATPMTYNEKSKVSFFEGLREWSIDRGTEVTERRMGIGEGFVNASRNAYQCAFNPPDSIRELGKLARIYYVTGNLSQMISMPLIGRWEYRPSSRQVIRSNDLQRYIFFHQLDPLIHEYLHAFQHLLYDHINQEGLIIKEHPRPSRIIEPPLFGYQLGPPSYRNLKKLERKIITKLIKHCSKP